MSDGLCFADLQRMDTFNDLDFIFLLIDIFVLVAGICAVAPGMSIAGAIPGASGCGRQ
jgi:hypothetical protein